MQKKKTMLTVLLLGAFLFALPSGARSSPQMHSLSRSGAVSRSFRRFL